MTSFFRQPVVFDILKDQVFPEIAQTRAGQRVRFWVPGCATGEEAYSLAIAWSESLGRDHPDKTSFQIFATDINQQAIDKARAGIYPQSIESDVSPERLARFFTAIEDGYRVVERLRETCVFARQDLTRDPPFSRLDLISLRNVLIYLDPLLQRRVLPILHFALRPGGFLMLGESESVSGFTDLFAVRDKKAKFYVRKEGLAALPPAPGPGVGQRVAMPEPPSVQQESGPFLEADRIVLEGYAPVGVLVDADRQIRQFRGHTGPYLESAPGQASLDLFRMAREGLAGELRIAVWEAEKTGSPVRRRGIRILREGQVAAVGFDVVPIKSSPGEVSFLILFLDTPPAAVNGLSARPARVLESPEDACQAITDLERELGEMREYTRAVLEDKEAANEELRSANEELQSTNEELQSVNEELETTSEEVQSANEELRTLNEELHSLNDRLSGLNQEMAAKTVALQELNAALDARQLELASARDYARAVIDTVREPLLVLDSDFRVVSASPPFYSIFETGPSDTLGRVFFELADGQWENTQLREALGRAFGEGGDFQDFLVDKDFARLGRRTLLLSGRRIHVVSDRTPNVLLAIEDITGRKQAEEALRESEERVRHKLDSLLSPEGDIGELELADVIDSTAWQSFLDDFHQLAGIPLAIIDLKGRVLAGAGWSDICTKFHRVHPDTCKNCIESDTRLTTGVPEGEFQLYKCYNNMWDVAAPIVVGGKHMGNVFSGQFFFEDEPIDRDLFRSQARQYGFDEETYLAALDSVPRRSRRAIETGMSFFTKLAGMLSNQSYAGIKLARSITERDALLESLRMSEERFRLMFERHGAVMLLIDPKNGAIVNANAAATHFYGYSREDLRKLNIGDLNELPAEQVAVEYRKAAAEERNHFIFPHRAADGQTRWVDVHSVPIEAQGKQLLFSIIQDITDRRRSEEERERLVTQLQQTATELASQQKEMEFRNEELRAAQEETVRLLSEESSLLGRLQGALLDIPAQLPGVEFGHLYRSATERAQVGGDFYDVFAGKNGRIGLLIGDVSGHGIDAARVASLVKDTVRAFARQFRGPHIVLRETNRLLVEKNRPGFVTAFLGFLDPDTGTLVYSSAGHPAPLVVVDGHVSPLESIGLPLGVFPDTRYRDDETKLQEGSPVLLYTDGMTEVRRGDELFGERGLTNSLARLCAHPVEELPALLLNEALLFSDGRLEDDAAMLAVRYVGKVGWRGGNSSSTSQTT